MLLAGIQANFGLDPRLKHSGVTTWGKVIQGPLDTPQLAAGLFIPLEASSAILLQSPGWISRPDEISRIIFYTFNQVLVVGQACSLQCRCASIYPGNRLPQ